MPQYVLQFDHVCKKYRKGTMGFGEAWGHLLGIERKTKALREHEFYALDDITLDIQQGEVWGVIGNNGAGKSTMLKLAGRIIQPSSGVVRGYGRVTGILEVGAGFKFELTGRENIFLSGYMLGMTKPEIRQKFDDIIAFSGIHDFVDTPIKNYSSGMYLRLAFAVAAFLRTEILIIDEVLAVGDADFQAQCLDRLHDNAARQGTTILFVSHNLHAVKQLCTKGIWLNKGKTQIQGNMEAVAHAYISQSSSDILRRHWHDNEGPGNAFIRLQAIELLPNSPLGGQQMDTRTALDVSIAFDCLQDGIILNLGLHLYTADGTWIFDVASTALQAKKSRMHALCKIPGNLLNDGYYKLSVIFVKNLSGELFYYRDALRFQLHDYRENTVWTDKWQGAVRPILPFDLSYA